MMTMIRRTMAATKHYDVTDFALLKTCLVAIGILMGLEYKKFFKRHQPLIWFVAIFSYVWVAIRTLLYYKREA